MRTFGVVGLRIRPPRPTTPRPVRIEDSQLAPANRKPARLRRARLLALSVPVSYAVLGCLWILISDLALESLQLPTQVSTRIAMAKGWIFVAGSTVLIGAVIRKAWTILERAYADLESELAQRRKAQEELARLAQELEERVQDRTRHLESTMSELSLFTDSVSHDLRAPLRLLTGYADALLTDHGGQLDPEAIRKLGRLSASADRMNRMINGLLELARHGRSALRIEPFEARLHELMVDEIWQEVSASHPGRDFRFERGPLVDAMCDPALLEHVWRNALSNAAKYTRGRNPAVISVEHRDGWFRIRDNGVGFDPAMTPKIFKPFERLHRSEEFEGDGIGLALAYRVIDRHGGAIEAESAPGEGTEIRFRLG